MESSALTLASAISQSHLGCNISCYAAAHISEADRFSTKYCSICDLYFDSKSLLRNHIDLSGRHPRCEPCNRSFLNMNALRTHWDISKRHHYCASTGCERHFETATGFRVHMEHSPRHHRRENLPSLPEFIRIHGYVKGWEDKVSRAMELEGARERELAFAAADGLDLDDLGLASFDYQEYISAATVNSVAGSSSNPSKSKIKAKSRMETTKTILALKQRMRAGIQPVKKLQQKCGICLCAPKKMKATRCGHVFCESCITCAFESTEACPVCRTNGMISQLREINLTTA
ncbi:hypothetical protein K435DRAFT_781208 [Dendrothele bispora CBS 962.96]|uniref:RING-type domain-containing protein n=1 Tax=Dendrothele bispora (strain CBS 962.96) TaxID=1314807 RepID=A0A4V4HEC5_DENBC|nr:hypothetical protein K435DRAFT_783403 [Dendrothele bispora CBS 962.96]THU90545.1 hypothetical protein K435DRAFT_781208 [Dendrothele bispora CBS 962.96]